MPNMSILLPLAFASLLNTKERTTIPELATLVVIDHWSVVAPVAVDRIEQITGFADVLGQTIPNVPCAANGNDNSSSSLIMGQVRKRPLVRRLPPAAHRSHYNSRSG